MWKSTFNDRTPAMAASDVRSNSKDPKVHPAAGLVKVLNFWVKAQRKAETEPTMNASLTQEQREFLAADKHKYGCCLTPASKLAPNCDHFDFTAVELLDATGKADIGECVAILKQSYYPWSAQSSSTTTQHHTGLAVSLLHLFHHKNIYTHYLGEHIVWNLFRDILAIVHQFSPSYTPWHGVAAETDRSNNKHQAILMKTFKGDQIGDVVGAGMANSVAALTDKYEKGLKKIWKSLVDVASHEHDGEQYLSGETNDAIKKLFLVSYCIIDTFSQ